MKFFTVLALAVVCTASLAAQSPKNSLDARRAQLRDALEADWEYTLRTSPTFATYVGDNRYNDRLGDYSAEFIAKQIERDKQQLQIFEAIDTTGFPEDEALNQQLMVRELKQAIEGAQFNNWQMPVNQFGGAHLGFASMPSQMPFKAVKDYENYIARLHQIPRALDQITANMKLGMANKLMPPEYLLEKVASQAQNIADSTEEKSPFTQPLKKFPAEISAADQQRLSAGVVKVVRTEVNPAYAKFAAFVKNDYAPNGRTEMGIWSLPNGAERYKFEIKRMTTTSMTPGQIHQLGVKQVEEIDAQMLAIARQQGFGDLKSFN